MLSLDRVKELDGEIKLRICYKDYLEYFDEDTTYEEYVKLTVEEYQQLTDSYDSFTDYIDCLTYSYINDVIGSPHSLV